MSNIENCQNLVDLIKKVSKDDKNGIYFVEAKEDHFSSYSEIYRRAKYVAIHLQSLGLKKGSELVFQLEDNKEFITTFWACLMTGVIPVPLSIGISEGQREKLVKVWTKLNDPFLITSERIAEKLDASILENRTILISDVQFDSTSQLPDFIPDEDDIAFIQFSSGSTGNPKGVALTHRNLLTNVQDIHTGINSPVSGDSFYSWMPLTHDMGLIGFHLTPLLKGWTHWIMPTPLFIRNPILWLRKIDEYEISFTSSPNFGYKYTLKHLERHNEDQLDFDLSSLRIIVNGAEPISANLCFEFNEKMNRFGLKPNVIFPVYGLAEASLAVTFSDPNENILTVELKRDKLGMGDRVEEISKSKESAAFVDVGKSLENCNTRIVDENGALLNDGEVGIIEIQGGNVTKGYYNDPEISKNIIDSEGWLNTGDLGVVCKGKLFVTGRVKDILFVNGQNFYAHDIERCIEELDNFELGKIVIVGYFEPDVQREKIVAFVLHKGKPETFLKHIHQIRAKVKDVMGFEIDVIVPTKKISKTTSGKVQRFVMLKEYQAGEYAEIEMQLEQLLLDSKPSIDDHMAQLDESEKKLVTVWKDVLGHGHFLPEQDFFHVGGNSLKAGEAMLLISNEFEVELSFSEVFENRSIKALAAIIRNKPKVVTTDIQPKETRDSYELSESQKRMFYFWKANENSIAYNNILAVELTGLLDESKLRFELNKLINRHELLRSVFDIKNGIPFQEILDDVTIEVETHLAKGETEEQLTDLLRPFDLRNGPLIRLSSIHKTQSKRTILLLEMHHVISDGSSLVLLLEELLQGYQGQSIEKEKIQFLDILEWRSKKEEKSESRDFWLSYLQGYEKLNLPLDSSRPAIYQYDGKKVKLEIGDRFTERLRIFAKDKRVSEFSVLLSLYKLFLAKCTQSEDLVVGIPVSGRNEKESLAVLGMFVNNLIIRSRPNSSKTVEDFIKEVSDKTYKAYDHQSYDFSELIADLEVKRDMSRNPIFDTMFVYQNMSFQALEKLDMDISPVFIDSGTSKFDLSMEVIDSGSDFEIYWEYNSHLFKDASIGHFSKLFLDIAEESLKDSKKVIANIGNESFKDAVVQGKQTSLKLEDSIFSVFEQKAKEEPNLIALEFGKEQMTYSELLHRVELLSTELMNRGVGLESPVSIFMHRSPDFLIAVLSILRAGGYFIPIDPELPQKRVDYMNTSGEVEIILTHKKLEHLLANNQSDKIVCVDSLELESLNVGKPYSVSTSNLAYAIYTSGTTGDPKGVLIEQRSLMNYSHFVNENYFQNESIRIPLYSSVSFDLTITSILPPLLNGGTIVIYDTDENELLIEKILREDKVDLIKLTPSHLKIVRDSNSITATSDKLKRIIIGGEELTSDLAKSIHTKFSGKVELYNEYGPTEATVGCMIYRFEPTIEYERSIPIGLPIDSVDLLVLDKNECPVPELIVGQLYVGGEGVARGYHNQKELTESRFKEIDGQRFYATGDYVRKNLEGDIEYFGRIDEQVKVNGYRIELGEIECQLRTISGIEEVTVQLHTRSENGSLLCAHVKCQDGFELSSREIKRQLLKDIPSYMLPNSVLFVDEIPLTVNGKVDVSKLADPFDVETSSVIEELSEREQILVGIWEKILNVKGISKEDNFFEIGGDSIKAVQIVSRLYDVHFETDVSQLIKSQTIQQLAPKLIEKKVRSYQQGTVEGSFPYTPVAKWLFDQEFAHPEYYNQSVLLELRSNYNKEELPRLFNRLIAMHDGLRINHDSKKKVLFYNSSHLTNDIEISEHHITFKTEENKHQQIQEIGEKVKSAFLLENGLLIKVALIEFDQAPPLLLITCHHLIIDGVSWRILLDDLYHLMKDGDTYQPSKTASLIDWSGKINEKETQKLFDNERTYWKDICSQIEQKSKEKQTGLLDNLSIELSENLTSEILNNYHDKYNTNPEIVLLTAVLRSMNETIGTENRHLDIESHGRSLDGINVSGSIGWFTSMFPQVIDIASKEIEADLLKVKECLRNIPNDGMGYSLVNNESESKVTASPDLRFNFLGSFDFNEYQDYFSLSLINSGAEQSATNKATADIEVNGMIVHGKLRLEFNWNVNQHDRNQLEKIANGVEQELSKIQDFLAGKEEVKFTPSDFSMSDLNQDDLDSIFDD